MLLVVIDTLNKRTARLRNNFPSANTGFYTKPAQRPGTSDTSREQADFSSDRLHHRTGKHNFNIRWLGSGNKHQPVTYTLISCTLTAMCSGHLGLEGAIIQERDVSSRHVIRVMFSPRNAGIWWSLSPLPHGTGGCLAETTIIISRLMQQSRRQAVFPGIMPSRYTQDKLAQHLPT